MLLLLFGGCHAALPSNPTRETVLTNHGPTGATYSRKRWREFLEAEEAAEAARLEKIRLEELAALEIAAGKAREARAALLAAREAQQREWRAQERVRQLVAAGDTAGLARSTQDTISRIAEMHAAATAQHEQMMQDDDDEAISLLLLLH